MAEAKKTVNYTAAELDTVKSMYIDLGNEGLDTIASTVGKSVRSIRSKLVREGVYQATPKKPAAKKDMGPSKKELLNQLEQIMGFDVTPLQGSTKEGLVKLIEFAQKSA
jgi:NAD(P)H-dependent flavin oxidoreductase YrpB (nitropropane dioxygenase family)